MTKDDVQNGALLMKGAFGQTEAPWSEAHADTTRPEESARMSNREVNRHRSMHALIREKGLIFWNIQRVALLQYIESARSSDQGVGLCKTRFVALRSSIMKIDAEIERLRAEALRTQRASV